MLRVMWCSRFASTGLLALSLVVLLSAPMPFSGALAKAPKCGAEGQRPCKLWERVPSCNKGLYENFKRKKCLRRKAKTAKRCGAEGQRPCRLWERVPSCNRGLAEDLLENRCRKSKRLLAKARRTLKTAAGVLSIGSQAAICLATGHMGLLTQAGRHRDANAGMWLLQSTCLGHVMRAARKKGYRTLTVGIAADAAQGLGASAEVGIAYDTAFKKPLVFYRSRGVSVGAQAGAGISVAISVLRAANDRIAGKGHGYVMGAKKLKGGGAGVWFNYDGDFEGATVMNAFGAGANAFAYNRTRTNITRISRNANYPGRKVARPAPPRTSPPKTSLPKRDDGWVEGRPVTGPGPTAKTVRLELPSSYVIRSQADARKSCRHVEIRTRGKWLGKWRVSIPGKSTLCLMRYELHGPRRLELEAGPIRNNAHAKQVCPALGHRLGGIWGNYWQTTVPGLMSVCTIEFTEATLRAAARRKPPPRKPPPQKAPPKRDAGWVVGSPVTGSGPKATAVDLELPSSFVIRTDADAKKSCRHVEINTRGTWLGKWRVSIPGKSTLCLMRYELHGSRFLHLEAGVIRNDGEAKTICPALAQRLGGIWEKTWQTTIPGHMALCNIQFTAATVNRGTGGKTKIRMQ